MNEELERISDEPVTSAELEKEVTGWKHRPMSYMSASNKDFGSGLHELLEMPGNQQETAKVYDVLLKRI